MSQLKCPKKESYGYVTRIPAAVVIVLSIIAIELLADSWRPPTPYEILSENKHFVAKIIPAKGKAKPILMVFSVADARKHEIWRTNLCNPIGPPQAFISNDGNAVVTTDDYFRIGYGENVVALYGPAGFLAKYSLEEIAPFKETQSNSPATYSSWRAYRKKFPHTTSSRHWQHNSIHFFHNTGEMPLFCLWLDWENRWVVWETVHGKLMKVDENLVRELNSEGRRRALANAQSGDPSSADLNFLGKMRFEEDRPVIEALFGDKHFSNGCEGDALLNGANSSFAFTARSFKRDEADKILERWDGMATEEEYFMPRQHYRFLGSLSCSVSFLSPPRRKDGFLRLYVIPATVSLDQWSQTQPEHYLMGDLKEYYPMMYGDGPVHEGQLHKTLDFMIDGVRPGKYQIIVVWDKRAPYGKTDQMIYRPQAGDYESETSPVIEVRKGEVTDRVYVDCSKLVVR